MGRVLFYDRRLSNNDSIACASCHLQEQAFADPRQFSRGFEYGHTNRNAMSLVNLRYTVLRGKHPGFFWDERAPTLAAQVLMPIRDKVEMGMEWSELENKLQTLPYYPLLFEAAFGSPLVTRDGISKAVAQFMRSMVSFDSGFDRAAATTGDHDYSADFADFIPAPETPPKINKGGSQHQLEEMKADSSAPNLAKRSLRPDEGSSLTDRGCVAHGNLSVFAALQSHTERLMAQLLAG